VVTSVLASNALIKVTPGLMIWTILCFLIVVFVLKRWAFGPIQKLIDERRERIRRALEEADHAREEARRLLEEHRQLIGQARGEAEEIRSVARQEADAQLRRVKEEAEAERQRRLADTARQIDAELGRALDQIRAEIADLGLVAAEKVTRRSLRDEDQRRLIDEAVGELDFSALERNDRAS
jgi:F-type H+-transporting ATPase subunit b